MVKPAEFIEGPSGPLEVVRSGEGEPVTLFAHGLGASIPSTRPFGSGVHGTRVFLHFRSHGRSAPVYDHWDYPHLAAELRAVADAVAARRALGVSMGAGSILRLLQDDSQAFERVVLVMPAVLDETRETESLQRYDRLADASQKKDRRALRAQLAAELPGAARGTEAASAWLDQQVDVLSGPGMAEALGALPREVPVPDLMALTQLELPVLILAQEGDPIHPVASAQLLADYLPNARLEIFDENGLLWGHRPRVRRVVAEFFNTGSNE